jgi:hypothetical protein
MNRADCLESDLRDPLARHRQQFVLPDGVLYLDGNSLGALPRTTAEAVTRVIEQEWGRQLIGAWNDAGWIDLPRRVGAKIARLIGAQPHEVLCADSTSVNLFKVLATALRLQAERPQVSMRDRRVILSERSNFPTDLYIAQGLADWLGSRYEIRLVEFGEIAAAIDDSVEHDAFEDRHGVPAHHLVRVKRLALFGVEGRCVDADQAHAAIMQQLERGRSDRGKVRVPGSGGRNVRAQQHARRNAVQPRGKMLRLDQGARAERVDHPAGTEVRIEGHFGDRHAGGVVVQRRVGVRAGVRRQRDLGHVDGATGRELPGPAGRKLRVARKHRKPGRDLRRDVPQSPRHFYSQGERNARGSGASSRCRT